MSQQTLAWLGGIVGCMGWLIGLAIVSAVADDWSVFWSVFAPGLAASLSAAFLALIVLHTLQLLFPHELRVARAGLGGFLLLVIPLAGMAVDTWVVKKAPPTIARLLDQPSFPRLYVTVAFLASAGLLGWVAIRLIKLWTSKAGQVPRELNPAH